MSRTFWFAAGAASGVYALVKARRTVQHFTPDGVAARVASLRTGARLFAADVSTGMAEREAQLRRELALPVGQSASPAAPALESLATPGAGGKHLRTPSPSHDHESLDHGHR